MSEGRKQSDPPNNRVNGRLTCRSCGCQHFEVVNTYPWEDGAKERRRQCRNCGWIARTVETLVE